MAENDEATKLFEESMRVIHRVVERKIQEIEKYRSIEGMEKLVEYLERDVKSYRAVLSDMGGEEYDPNMDNDDPLGKELRMSGLFREYMDSLQIDDLEDELAADGFRCDYYEDIMDVVSFEVGMSVLASKKMIKALRMNEYAVMAIGDLIMRDETLSQLFDDIVTNAQKTRVKKKKTK